MRGRKVCVAGEMAIATDGTRLTGLHFYSHITWYEQQIFKMPLSRKGFVLLEVAKKLSSHHLNLLVSFSSTLAEPGFPPGGAPTYNFAKFFQKLYGIERIWTPRRGRASLAPTPPFVTELCKSLRELGTSSPTYNE